MTSSNCLPRSCTRRRDLSSRARRGGGGAAAAFTFLEIIVVMAVIGVLLGLGIGFLANVGRSALATQAAAILTESGQRCLNLSAGGNRASLEVAEVATPDGGERLEIRTAVQRQVLTAHFESRSQDTPDPDWGQTVNEYSHASITGSVSCDLNGKAGACAVFKAGGLMDYGTRSAFAMTDGLRVQCSVRPDGTGQMMLLRADAEGTTLWQLRLAQGAGRTGSFDVELSIRSVSGDYEGATPSGFDVTVVTTGAPVPAGVWTELIASWDGRDGSIQVNGFERRKDDRGKSASSKNDPAVAARKARRLYVPPSGAVRLTTGPTFVGALDTLTVAGIFRNDEDVRELPIGVTAFRTALPIRVVFSNGQLDPTVHKSDVRIRLQGPSDVESGVYTEARFGLYGSLPPPYRGVVGGDEAMK